MELKATIETWLHCTKDSFITTDRFLGHEIICASPSLFLLTNSFILASFSSSEMFSSFLGTDLLILVLEILSQT